MPTTTESVADTAGGCQAYEDGEPCPNDADHVVDGVPLCDHHADRSDIYDFPR